MERISENVISFPRSFILVLYGSWDFWRIYLVQQQSEKKQQNKAEHKVQG